MKSTKMKLEHPMMTELTKSLNTIFKKVSGKPSQKSGYDSKKVKEARKRKKFESTDSKEDLNPFINNAMKWVRNMKGMGSVEVHKVRSYLKSNEFFAHVMEVKSSEDTQKEFNTKITELVADKAKEILSE